MILRRIKYGDTIEGIEIVPEDERSKSIAHDDISRDEGLMVKFIKEEEDVIFYYVHVPNNFRVKPQDLRRHAYDHKQVDSLVENCVKDNLGEHIFEPLSESTLKRIQSDLSAALQDLSSVLDLLSVECQAGSSPGTISAEVKFEYKNGQSKAITIALNQS
ncbi:MAG: hypothetical protein P8184_07365 [Calditrichia bacterium]